MLVSIIMPVFNAESTLARSIGSILDQTFSNWELICVDDGSTDSSLSLLYNFANSESRIKVFSKNNTGPGLTRNFAINKCSGDYIAFLDSDDVWCKKCVEEITNDVKAHDSDIIFLRTKVCYKKKCKDAYNINHFVNCSKADLTSCLMSGVLPWGQEKVVRSSIVKEHKLCFSSDPVGEEAIFSFEAIRHSNIISFITDPMYYYYFVESGQHKLGQLDPWFNIVLKMKNHLEFNQLFEQYESSLNSLALRSLTISMYRICIQYSFNIAKKHIINKYQEYNQLYNLNNCNAKSLDKKTIIIFALLKKRFFLLIYLLSRFRNRSK